jgi:hypothetical protein
MINFWNFTAKKIAIASLPASLIVISLPNLPANSYTNNQYDICFKELTQSGFNPEQAGNACAQALNPKDLSWCVLAVTQKTEIVPEKVLDSCLRVRRPIEMARCVLKIQHEAIDPNVDLALETCRRSLIPKNYSECVVALSRNPNNLPAQEAMRVCIAAKDNPN